MASSAPAEPIVKGEASLLLRFPRLVLALVCLVLWLPALLSLPPLDRDESRFAQASRQMLERHDFIDIRFGNEARYKKPVGIYWLQAATTEIAGFGRRDRIWTYRLASLLGGIAASWLIWSIARSMVPERAALAAAALFSATLLLSAESMIATTDAVLVACVLVAQRALLRLYAGAREGASPIPLTTVLLGWAGVGFGILVKGPVAPAISLATILALVVWDRNVRWLSGIHLARGLLIVGLIVAPWALSIAYQSHGQFYAQALGTDFAAKLAGGQEMHGAPPGYYLVLVTITLWPATLYVLPGLRAGLARRREAHTRFLLAWAGSAWLMFEAVPTKLPHYILPAYPALIALAALWLARGDNMDLNPGWRWASTTQYLCGLALLAGGVAVAAGRFGAGLEPLFLGMIGAVALSGCGAAILFLRQRELAACAAAIIAAGLLYSAIAVVEVPHLQTLWVSNRLASAIRRAERAGDPPPALAGFDEPSLLFELGTKTRLTDGRGAALALAQRGGIAGIEDSERPTFLRVLSDDHALAVQVDEVGGLNYSRGHVVHIGIYRVTPASHPR